jgi:mannose-6-phosphate isomerase-like protein (cupin superfamily)
LTFICKLNFHLTPIYEATSCEGWHLVQNPGLSVIQESMPPQTAEVPHYHLRSRQFFFVLTGQLSVATPSGEHILSVEQGIEIPPGVPHHVRNNSGGVTRFLVISSPASHDDRTTVSEINHTA